MTSSNHDETSKADPAQQAAADLLRRIAELDVNGLAAEASGARSRLRAQLAEVREGFDQLKVHLQHTVALKDTTKDLLAAFKRTSEALAAESAVIEREKAALERDKTALLAQRREVGRRRFTSVSRGTPISAQRCFGELTGGNAKQDCPL